jgi:acetyl-CoA C-acetyltransferase
MASDPVVILSAARTPLGRFMGELSPFSAHRLGSHVIGAALERARLAPERIDEVFMGNVLPAGQGQAPARQAARGAKLPDATGATTVNKVCGSGMKATMLAHDIITAGSAEIVLSGGMESMSNAPYLLAKARGGYRAGHDRIIDHMMMDGLEDAYETGRSMGDFGEATAEAYQFSRKDQDAYAMETLSRARKAVEGGAFRAEIAPITVNGEGRTADHRQRRASAQGRSRQDPRAKTRVPRQRHHYAGGIVGERRWRRGAHSGETLARRSRRAPGAGRDQGPRHS